MRTLLNEERTKRGLRKVEPDSELRSVALVHSVDMAQNRFFSHVSPTTGIFEERLAKAKVRVSKGGECIALQKTPAGAYRALLGSPAHRAGMLDPAFTHVGIGASFEDGELGTRRIAFTLAFGRRPPTDDTRLTAAEIHRSRAGIQKGTQTFAAPGGLDPHQCRLRRNSSPEIRLGEERGPSPCPIRARTLARRAHGMPGLPRMIDRFQLSEILLFHSAEIRTLGIRHGSD